MVSETIHERYLRDPLPIRLGGLAVDLARIASCCEDPRNHNVVASVLEESKWFAEWAAPEAPLDTQEVLADVQRWLAFWHAHWLTGHMESRMRNEAQRWSETLLKVSGLAQ